MKNGVWRGLLHRAVANCVQYVQRRVVCGVACFIVRVQIACSVYSVAWRVWRGVPHRECADCVPSVQRRVVCVVCGAVCEFLQKKARPHSMKDLPRRSEACEKI